MCRSACVRPLSKSSTHLSHLPHNFITLHLSRRRSLSNSASQLARTSTVSPASSSSSAMHFSVVEGGRGEEASPSEARPTAFTDKDTPPPATGEGKEGESRKELQGDHSGCVKPPVDFKTKVLF